jgi:hypothetical protein
MPASWIMAENTGFPQQLKPRIGSIFTKKREKCVFDLQGEGVALVDVQADEILLCFLHAVDHRRFEVDALPLAVADDAVVIATEHEVPKLTLGCLKWLTRFSVVTCVQTPRAKTKYRNSSFIA